MDVGNWEPTCARSQRCGKPGTLPSIDLAVRAIAALHDGASIANFDGIITIGSAFYGTDWSGGRLLRIDADATVTPILSGFRQLADLGFRPDTRQLGRPEMSACRILMLTRDRDPAAR